MTRFNVALLFLIAPLALGSRCPEQTLPAGVENPLLPREWAQDHGNRENSGFNAVHSTFALAPLKKWTTSVGELASSGPVVGPDGFIYVGTVTGDVVSLDANGQQRWRRNIDQSIVTSPTVDTETGDVFIMGQRVVDTAIESRIFRLDSGGGLHASTVEPLVTASSPKIWREFVFISSQRRLLVFDKSTLALVGQIGPIDCFGLVCGTTDTDNIFESIFSQVLCMASLGTTHALGIAECCCSFNPTPAAATVEPSVAIVDAPALSGDIDRPIVVLVSTRCATAIRFYPAGDAAPAGVPPIDRHFELLWSHPLVNVNCDFDTVRPTTPAVVLGGQVIIGDNNGRVLSLDLFTGDELWHKNVGPAIVATPVTALRQIYVVTEKTMVMLDSDGDLLDQALLRGTGHSAAMSLDFVYVTTSQGVHTFDLDPADGFAFDGSVANDTHVGTAMPALGTDGTLYVSTPNGFVHAYSRTGVLAIRPAIPGVEWQSPSDGAVIEANGTMLSVNVSGVGDSAFAGTVRIESDVDGLLCETTSDGGAVNCTPAFAFSPGEHRLTAFAEDNSGGSNIAQIVVQVESEPAADDSAPVVSIVSPTVNGAYNEMDPVDFSATVSDPDEPAFPSGRVRWTSNIDGDLGAGLTLQRHLTMGTHTITATATDSTGLTGSKSVVILVVGS